MSRCQRTLSSPWQSLAVALGTLAVALPVARAQQIPAQQPVQQIPAQPAAAGRIVPPFDVAQQPGQHPLSPFIRACKESLAYFDQNVRDYQCLFQKQEQIDGELQDPQLIELKVLQQPFSVYMKFQKPYEGREVIYIDGQNDGDLIALEGGWKRHLGKMHLDPEGSIAMSGQKYPITRIGIHNLLEEMIRFSEADTKFAECEVKAFPDAKILNRSCTAFEITHPVPRQNFRFHIVRVCFDNELRIPIHFEAYLWPSAGEKQPPLEETYTYRNLRLNTGLTPTFFDPDGNPQIFQ